jgi:hypothetical protein
LFLESTGAVLLTSSGPDVFCDYCIVANMWLLYAPVVALLGYLVYNRFFHPLAKVPGPFLASLNLLWLVWQCMHQRRPRLDLELHNRYGSIVRITPNSVIFSNPEYCKAVYGAGTTFKKSRYYEAPADLSQNPGWEKLDLLPEMDIDKLRLQKRLAGSVYSTANAKKHEDLIDNIFVGGSRGWEG